MFIASILYMLCVTNVQTKYFFFMLYPDVSALLSSRYYGLYDASEWTLFLILCHYAAQWKKWGFIGALFFFRCEHEVQAPLVTYFVVV